MSDTLQKGNKGEEIAASFLKTTGYRIRERNWKTGRNEIDIIAENDNFIVFVEVKSRAADFLVNPREAVNVPKQRTIIFAASNYIKNHNIIKESRFDIITVIFNGNDYDIDHIQAAYYPTL